MDIPVIDISGFDSGGDDARRTIAAQWDKAFKTIGFASIVGHGIPETLFQAAYAEARHFFELPLNVKMRNHDPAVPEEGYAPMGIEAVGRSEGQTTAATPPDLSEAIQFVNLHIGENKPDTWPPLLPNFRPIIERLAREASVLERRIMRISAIALGLPEDYFDAFYERMSTKIRLVQYPDQPNDPLPGQLRNAAHTDFGGFTILRQDDAPGGLQVKIPDGEWLDVRTQPGALVINAGDLIQRWTNDIWRSNLHRVINPPRGLTGSTRRLSIVVFTGPHPDTVITCLPTCFDANGTAKYAPVSAREHTRERVRLTYLTHAA